MEAKQVEKYERQADKLTQELLNVSDTEWDVVFYLDYLGKDKSAFMFGDFENNFFYIDLKGNKKSEQSDTDYKLNDKENEVINNFVKTLK